MPEHDRPLTAATLNSATSHTRTEVEHPSSDVLELYDLPVTNRNGGNGAARNGHGANCLYAPGTSSASLSSGETRVVPVRTVTGARGMAANRYSLTDSRGKKLQQQQQPPRVWTQIRRFWSQQVALVVPQKSNRDHFALERTFLAYLRTSVILSMQGVLIAQLFRLQRFSSQERYGLTYYDVAIPLSVSCHGMALLIAIVGAYRFWRQQSSITDGKVLAGGWELNSIGVMISLIVLALFVLGLAITVGVNEMQ